MLSTARDCLSTATGARPGNLVVDDHCNALTTVLTDGQPGKVYNVGSGHELSNLELAHRILALTGQPLSLIEHVEDRLGHDRRYAVDSSRLRSLGWAPTHEFDAALEATVAWYREHEAWWRPLKSGEYLERYRRQLGRLGRRAAIRSRE
jgi:dTDP-glucose 4,6-dehydratase